MHNLVPDERFPDSIYELDFPALKLKLLTGKIVNNFVITSNDLFPNLSCLVTSAE